MCIFTYTPLERGLLFTSNRDEVVSRPTAPPDRHPHKGEVLIYPRDHQKGGSWIGMNLTTKTLGVLLNAKTKTPPKPNAFSRGWILLDLITQTRGDRLCQKLKHTPPISMHPLPMAQKQNTTPPNPLERGGPHQKAFGSPTPSAVLCQHPLRRTYPNATQTPLDRLVTKD